MARVYVSSTYQDLADHREIVRLAVRRLGHEDIAMEYYVAEDRRPVDRCLEDVRSADLYIVIMAWRYGFIPPGHDRSITELEYRTALDAGVPCLVFVLSEDHPWPPRLMERSARVDEFREELVQNRIAGLFGSKDDLARQVAEGIQAWEREGGTTRTSVDWGAYREAVVDWYRWVRLSVIAGAQHDRMVRIPLLDVFVPQQLRAGRPHYDLPDEEGVGGPAPAEDGVAVLGREPKQVILGGPGSGKSTLFQASLLAISDVAGDARRIPLSLQDLPLVLLIELRDYVLTGSQDFLSYLETTIWTKYSVRVTEEQLLTTLDGGAVVFFDGLDEVFTRSDRGRVVDQFRAFTNRFPKARVVVSSRIVGYDASELGLAGFKHYTLLDFGLKEISEFVPGWYRHYTLESDERDAPGLVRRIADNVRLLELAGNPLLLTMMAVIYQHQDLPEKRWQLYERCTGVLLEDWDVKRKRIKSQDLLPLGFPLGREQKAEILQNIAMTMSSSWHRAGTELNAIRYEPLRDIIASYLERQYAKPPGEARAIAVEILNHLRERTFIVAETGDGVFGFVHRTFMEYFAAKHVLAEFNGRKADYDWLKREVFWKHWEKDQWREPLLLLSAMLAGQGSPIREIVTAVAEIRRPPALPFAMRCLGETGLVPPEDQEWATELADAMVANLITFSPKADNRAQHAADVTSALASLTGVVALSDKTRAWIRRLRDSSAIGNRIIGFQLELAIASREERRQAALSGLADPDEAVRRAAVAVLDREPVDETVFTALLARFRVETNIRVREPLIAALDRGWPRRPEVLDVIARRARREKSYTHAIWLAEHLATAWAGDVAARALVPRLTEHVPVDHRYGVVEALTESLVRGWKDSPDFTRFLFALIEEDAAGSPRTLAIRACAMADLDALCEWFWQHTADRSDLREMAFSTTDIDSVRVWMWKVWEEHRDEGFRRNARVVLDTVVIGPHQ